MNVDEFNLRRAVCEDYDILLTHWPERAVERGSPARALLGAAALIAVGLRCRLRRVPVVQFVHNLQSHDGPHRRIESFAIGAFDRLTTHAVHLSHVSLSAAAQARPHLPAETTTVLRHGQDEQPTAPPPKSENPRLLSFGAVRPYKNIEAICRSVAESPTACELRIVGAPADADVAQSVETAVARTLAAGRPISSRLVHLSAEELDAELEVAHAVVIGHDRFLNSGSVLHALSRSRPVIAPNVGSVPEVRNDVGAEWVFAYDPPISGQTITDALAWLASRHPSGDSPDLGAYSWRIVGEQLGEWLRTLTSRR